MNTRLEQLRGELAAPLPHPDAETLRVVSQQTLDWVLNHWQTLPNQPIGKSGSRAELEALLRESAPENGREFGEVLAEFQEKVAAYAFRTKHPRFLAFIPSAPNFVSVLGDFLCSGTNFFAGVWLEAAGPSEIEVIVLDWFKEFLGYPQEAGGILTSGGSEANLTALVVARERLAYQDRSRAILYLTEQRHWSVDRAAKVIGLRPDQFCAVPADKHFRVQPSALLEAIGHDRQAGLLPWAVVANAGATNTGAVDPLASLADVCREHRLWLHVDAAYGWPAVLLPAERAGLDGISRADSVTLDPHKWFAQPFEAGCLLVREGRRLAEAFTLRPEYMQDVAPATGEINFADHGIALTRRFRALKIWLSVKVLGVSWFRNLIERCCRLAELAQALLEQSPRFEILCPRQLSIICFRYLPADFLRGGEEEAKTVDQLNLAIVDGVRASGRAFLSSTRLQGRVALRFCFVNWRTTAADVEEVVQLVETAGAQASGNVELARERH
jgi:glutamate/tyrosine decarboxylase-like PLP-dependent enzyme